MWKISVELLKLRYLAASAIATAVGDAAIHIMLSRMLSGAVRYTVSFVLGIFICAFFQILHTRDIHDLSRNWRVVLGWVVLSALIGLLIYVVFDDLVRMDLLGL